MSTTIQLYDDNGAPLWQPFSDYGLKYHRPYSSTSRTYWTDGRSRKKFPAKHVAQITGVPEMKIRKWENAADLEAEGDGRSDFGDW